MRDIGAAAAEAEPVAAGAAAGADGADELDAALFSVQPLGSSGR